MAKRGRPRRDREQERAVAEAVLEDWWSRHRVHLMFSRSPDGGAEVFPRLLAELEWLRLRLGDSEEAVDTLDALLKPGSPPPSDSLT